LMSSIHAPPGGLDFFFGGHSDLLLSRAIIITSSPTRQMQFGRTLEVG
jgi:hypothetical protein